MAENPVIRRFASNVATPSAIDLQKQYEQPAYVGARPNQRFMTLDDVVQRTAAMLLTILAAGAVAWTLSGDSLQHVGPLLLVGLMGGVGLGLFMAFTGRANAPLCLAYSVCEGLLLGAVSKAFETRWHGIVIQAITGTVMVAIGMLFVYKIGAIRVTPRFTRIVIGATIGVVRPDGRQPGGLSVQRHRPGAAQRRAARDRVQPGLHRDRRDEPGRRLRRRRAGHPDGRGPEVRLVRLVRHHRHPRLALHRDPAPAGLHARLGWVVRNYLSWHDQYDDPDSPLAWRLGVVRELITEHLDGHDGPSGC